MAKNTFVAQMRDLVFQKKRMGGVMTKLVYDIIKKQNGEAFAKAIRNYDSGIFDVPDLARIVRYAGRNALQLLPFLESLKEIQFLSKWTFSVEDAALPSESEQLVGFRLGNTLGYFSPAGNFAYKYEIPLLKTGKLANVTVSSDCWTIFDTETSEFTICKPDGSKLVKFSSQGNPFLQENRLFLFTPGGASFIHYDLQGNELWRSEGYVPIISFSSSPEGTVAGYADGEIRCLTDTGDLAFSMYPGGSTYPVVLGVDISDSGEYVACVSGIDSQRFVLIRQIL